MLKKIISLMMVICLLIALGGCSNKDKSTNVNGTGEKANQQSSGSKVERPTITVLFPGDDAASALTGGDRIIKEIEDRLDIVLELKPVPERSFEKINVAVASGDIPDVVVNEFPTSAVSKWINDGVLIPINKYFDSMPTVKAQCELESWTAVDGDYYGYPFITQKGSTNYNIVTRGDWLEELNMDEPETLEDFYHMLVAFKEAKGAVLVGKKFSGNGLGDLAYVFHANGLKYADWALDKDGNVIPTFEDPAFKEGMKFLNKLWNEGLIDPEFMMNDSKMAEEKYYQGKGSAVSLPLYRHVSRHEGNLQGVDPNGKLAYIAPPKGNDGSQGFAPMGKSGMITGVTYASDAPEKAAAFIEFMVSKEGRDLLTLGIEGIHYSKDGDSITYLEDARKEDHFASNGWSHPLAWGTVAWPLSANYLPETEPNRERALHSVELASSFQVENLLPMKTQKEIEIAGIVNEIFADYYINMITGGIDIEKGLVELSNKWRSQGGNDILKEAQELYESK